MIKYQGLTLYPLTPEVIVTHPDLDPPRHDELILQRGSPARLIRDVCQSSDALYYWDGPWRVLSGSRGIAIVRDGHVIETFTTIAR